MQANPPQHSEKLKVPVEDNRFTQIEVDNKGGQLRKVLERRNLQFKPGCAFFEFINKQEDIDEKKQVIIMNKVYRIIESDSEWTIIITAIIIQCTYRKQERCLLALQHMQRLVHLVETLITPIFLIEECLYRVCTKATDSSIKTHSYSMKYVIDCKI
ncbi:MAG: hypothetical protein MJE68_01340 [Proteobacteria bacterium]|nr:hypothetical protein [Pseudomonadota bacterium]